MSGNTWHLGLPDTGHWRRGRQTVQLLSWSAWQRAGLENTGWKHKNLAVNQCSYVLWTGKKRKVCWKKRLPLILLMSSSFNLHQPLIVMVPLISYYQPYLPCGKKRVFEEGYSRMFAKRPTGSRASRQSASSGQSILGQMTQSHPSTKSHHQKTPNPYLRRPCRSLPRLIASR